MLRILIYDNYTFCICTVYENIHISVICRIGELSVVPFCVIYSV